MTYRGLRRRLGLLEADARARMSPGAHRIKAEWESHVHSMSDAELLTLVQAAGEPDERSARLSDNELFELIADGD